MPLSKSYNTLAQNNEQPEYQMLWEPVAINPASVTTALTLPTAAFTGSWSVGSLLQYGLTSGIAGVGTNPGPGGDNSTITWTTGVPSSYTVQYVDLSAPSATTAVAGIFLGSGSLGAPPTVAPNSASLNSQPLIAMVGKRGICQVLYDVTSIVGNTFLTSTTASHNGMVKDSGVTTRTYGTHFGIALQAVTISAGPLLVWCHVNVP